MLLDALMDADPEHPALVNSVQYRTEDIVKTARAIAAEARGFLELYAKLVSQLWDETVVDLILDLVCRALQRHPESLHQVPEGLRATDKAELSRN